MMVNYVLTVHAEEEDSPICVIEANSMESLEEQLSKVEGAVRRYEEQQEVRMQMEISRQEDDLEEKEV